MRDAPALDVTLRTIWRPLPKRGPPTWAGWPALTSKTHLYHLARTLDENPEALRTFQELVGSKEIKRTDLLGNEHGPAPLSHPGTRGQPGSSLPGVRPRGCLSVQVSVFQRALSRDPPGCHPPATSSHPPAANARLLGATPWLWGVETLATAEVSEADTQRDSDTLTFLLENMRLPRGSPSPTQVSRRTK